MFPSQKSLRTRAVSIGPSGFNGAGMFPSQKCLHGRNHGAYRRASMGPGCFHRRNAVTPCGTCLTLVLQWGRDVSIPEMVAVESVQAMIAPLQWGRDVSIPEIRSYRTSRKAATSLQWARDVSIPEIQLDIPSRSPRIELQWGRDVSIPEIIK